MSAGTSPAGPEPVTQGAKPTESIAGSARSARLRETMRNILSQRSAQVGLIILTILIASAILAPVIAPYDPEDPLNGPGEPGRRADPCIHLLGCPEDQMQTYLGTDGNSRDIFSRVIWGGRLSIPLGPAVVGFAILIGAVIGSVAGFVGGMTDNLLMRGMDIVLSFPALILAIAIVTVLGIGLVNSVAAVVIVSIPLYARLTRSAVLSTRENDYVTASRALGESGTGILRRRVIPNSITPLIVAGSLGIATAVLEVAALSFLGLGMPVNKPSLGSLINSGFEYILSGSWWITAFPAVVLVILVLVINLLGDWLRDVLNPKLYKD